mmetsp:Transcript_22775/g.61725  ORF Transcript_22775/g.61725 Transcript_22775/m.61725 type:complete len:216 (-) Transcript_22775:2245-2892(-)
MRPPSPSSRWSSLPPTASTSSRRTCRSCTARLALRVSQSPSSSLTSRSPTSASLSTSTTCSPRARSPASSRPRTRTTSSTRCGPLSSAQASPTRGRTAGVTLSPRCAPTSTQCSASRPSATPSRSARADSRPSSTASSSTGSSRGLKRHSSQCQSASSRTWTWALMRRRPTSSTSCPTRSSPSTRPLPASSSVRSATTGPRLSRSSSSSRSTNPC